jgi:hypothetical protein
MPVCLALDLCRLMAQSVAMLLKRLCRCSVQAAGLPMARNVARHQQSGFALKSHKKGGGALIGPALFICLLITMPAEARDSPAMLQPRRYK